MCRVMEQMSDVVKAMLKRVKVDLSGDEVGLALQTFSAQLWGDARRRSELRTHAATLCKLLKLQSRTVVPVVASIAAGRAQPRQSLFLLPNVRGAGGHLQASFPP